MPSISFYHQQKPVYMFNTEIDQILDKNVEPISNKSFEETFEYDNYLNKTFYCNQPNIENVKTFTNPPLPKNQT